MAIGIAMNVGFDLRALWWFDRRPFVLARATASSRDDLRRLLLRAHVRASTGRRCMFSRMTGGQRRGDEALPALHELEQEVMDEMWRLEQAPVRTVLEALNERAGRQRAYTTIMTIMGRLHGKGFLTRELKGRQHVYSPALSREEYAEARAAVEVEALVDEWGEVALVHFAREMARLDPDRRRKVTRRARRA